MSERATPTIAEIRQRLENAEGKEYWQGLDELADDPSFHAFMAEEFPRQSVPLEGTLHRRDVLKLLGASLALAGLTACARPQLPRETIVPYVEMPEQAVPGKPVHYATAIEHAGYAEGLLVESHQGRPTKVEGNPDQPGSLGATSASTQATVLSLYDPERSTDLTREGEPSDWESFTGALAEAVDGLDDGAGLAVLTETVTSPTLARQLDELRERYPQMRWHQYDARHADAAVEGARLAFGEDVQPIFDFEAAQVVLSLDADFTHRGPGRLAHARAFARSRRVRSADDAMNRHYQVEPSPTPTGALADHRIATSPAGVAALAHRVARGVGLDVPDAELPEGVDPATVDAIVADLQDAEGRSLVVAGPEQGAAVHALAHALNDALGNVGTTVRYRAPVEARPENERASLTELTEAMRAGEVQVLVILDANPAYTAPADVPFAEALAEVPFSVHLGTHRDETGEATTWHVPGAHHLETWGDARAFDGTATILQPLIQPFYGGRASCELLAALAGVPDASAHDLVRATWEARVDGDVEAFWRTALHRGAIEGTAAAELSPQLQELDLPAPPVGDDLALLLRPDPSVEDGRWANNGWLQELPKPFSKLTWDNAAHLSPRTAEALGVENEDLLDLSVGGATVTAPVWVLPGQADGVVLLHLGFGRRAAGRVGNGVGVDAYRLLRGSDGAVAAVAADAAAGRHRLASTQSHFSLDGTGERRHIVRHGTLAEVQAEPDGPHFVHPVEHHASDLYPNWEYDGYAWGMVVDMSVCTGCNACVTACQSENNVPIVGKDQVLVGREMHWIRVDTYHAGGLDDPSYYHMPMMCQHCEKAPCEPVCPVGATVHDHEGLNVMVYNRCVGTRYCSNNCPYKVRRFNYLQYAELEGDATEASLAHNPDVTVRSRGVMEKCTYCTQRISRARIDAEREDRRIQDGEVVTACQAACPTEAIVFGDLNDEDSRVQAEKGSILDYAVLEELNTVPRTSYLAHVRNPNPALDDSGAA